MQAEVVSINEYDQHQLQLRDRIMESAVDQLEAITKGEKMEAEMMVQFRGLVLVDDPSPRLFEFDPPTYCQRWPGLRFGPFCLHKQLPKPVHKTKMTNKSSEKKHGLDVKHGTTSRKSATSKPKKARTKVPAPSISSTVASRNPPLHLLDLPAEIKNEIYTLLAVQTDPIEAQLRPIQTGRKGKIVIRRFPQEPTLAAVNKQLRQEVLSLFYGLNKFVFEKSTSAALKDYDVTSLTTMSNWKPRCDVVNFLTQLEMRFDLSIASSTSVSFMLRRQVDTSVSVSVKSWKSNKQKRGWYSMCMCAEEIVRRHIERVAGQEDLVEVAMALVIKRREVLSTTAIPLDRTPCEKCGFDMI